jgi:hypothetical protein
VSWDGDGRLRAKRATALEEDLGTASVGLGVSDVGTVQSENLRTGEVVAAFEALGELDVEKTLVVDNLVSAPALGGGVVAVVEDLEPSVSSGLVVDGGGDLLQVDGTWSVVATVDASLGCIVCPLTDLEC